MAALPSQPAPSTVVRAVHKVKGNLDNLLTKMRKDNKFSPTRDQLEEQAELLIDFINDNHAKIAAHESYLKAAIIDLTEVPVMAPQMQRISYQTAIKDALDKLNLFLSCF